MRRLFVAVVVAATVGACSSSGGTSHTSAGSSPSSSTATTTSRPTSVHATLAPWSLPAPLTRPAVAITSDRVFLLGGLTAADVSTARVVTVDTATGHSSLAGSLAEAVHDAAAATVGGVPTVFGGGSARTIDIVQGFTAPTGHVVGHLPRARSDLSSAVIGDTAYVVGGFDGSALTPDVLATTDAVHFRTVGRLNQGVRYAAVAAVGHNIWVAGGQTGTAEGATGSEVDLIQRIDVDTGTATVVGHLPHRLAHAMAFALDGHLYLAGGRTASGPLTDLLAIADDGTVTPVGSLPGPRADAGVAVVANTAFLFGGETTGPTKALASVVEVAA
ncbi:MAG: hypothetical protein JO148_02520 [Acidimicrobiia bacterium]|nr:hypothetical protein [Acidimicrobiia bacterium]